MHALQNCPRAAATEDGRSATEDGLSHREALTPLSFCCGSHPLYAGVRPGGSGARRARVPHITGTARAGARAASGGAALGRTRRDGGQRAHTQNSMQS